MQLQSDRFVDLLFLGLLQNPIGPLQLEPVHVDDYARPSSIPARHLAASASLLPVQSYLAQPVESYSAQAAE
jgi:hypothetical protein